MLFRSSSKVALTLAEAEGRETPRFHAWKVGARGNRAQGCLGALGPMGAASPCSPGSPSLAATRSPTLSPLRSSSCPEALPPKSQGQPAADHASSLPCSLQPVSACLCWNITPSGRNAPGPPPHISTPLLQPTWARQTALLRTQCLSPRAPVPRWGAGEESWPSSEELGAHPGSRRAVDHTDSRGVFRRQRPRSPLAPSLPWSPATPRRTGGNSESCRRAGCAPGRLLRLRC